MVNENLKQFYILILLYLFLKNSTITTLSSKNLLESFVFQIYFNLILLNIEYINARITKISAIFLFIVLVIGIFAAIFLHRHLLLEKYKHKKQNQK